MSLLASDFRGGLLMLGGLASFRQKKKKKKKKKKWGLFVLCF